MLVNFGLLSYLDVIQFWSTKLFLMSVSFGLSYLNVGQFWSTKLFRCHSVLVY